MAVHNCKYCKAECGFCGENRKSDCRGYIPMTNADKVRALSDEHLANYLLQFSDVDCMIGFCRNLPKCEALLDTEDGIPLSMCEKCLLAWLKQPAEDGGNG